MMHAFTADPRLLVGPQGFLPAGRRADEPVHSRACGRLTIGSLVEEVGLTTGGVTRLVDRMEAAGYVEQVHCSTDRRVSYASLTDRGRAKLDRLRAVREPGRAPGR
jgi:DNA-binding MarR family transcriptional regulator